MTINNRFAEQESEKLVIHLKRDEFYSFVFNRENKTEMLRTTGRYADNPELTFNWHDAAVVSQKIRSLTDSSVEVAVATIDPNLKEVPIPPESFFGVALRRLLDEIK